MSSDFDKFNNKLINDLIDKCVKDKNKMLDLQFNTLTHIPFFPSHFMLSINCSNNKLRSLPDLPSSLEILECSCNQLIQLPKLPRNLCTLTCYNNELLELPELPSFLITLECDDNQLIKLPALPDRLEILQCDGNHLTELPKLPPELKELTCYRNKLIKLPELPASLIDLECDGNKLIELPILPPGLSNFDCQLNEFLYIPTNIAKKFGIYPTRNYNQVFRGLKKMMKSRTRLKKLLFCDKLRIAIDSYLYRPGGVGYYEVADLNKGKWFDL